MAENVFANLNIKVEGDKRDLDAIRRQQLKTAKDVEKTWDKSTKKVESDFQRMTRSVQGSLRKVGDRMKRVGGTLTTFVSLPATAALAGMAKAAIDFESAFAGVRKTVDASEAEFRTMSKQIRALSREIPISSTELAGLAEIAGQLGVQNDAILDFTETIALLGETTNVSGEQAALSLSRFMNVMGTAQGDIDRLGSTIVALGNNFAARESEIVDISTSLATFGNTVGLSETQVLAFATAIAASGGEAQAASTAFQKIGQTMKSAVISGNEDLETFAQTAGVTAEKFQQAFREDAAGAIQTFLEGLRRIDEQGGDTAVVLENLGLADQRLIRETGKVIGNLDQLTGQLNTAKTAWEENTALTEEAEKRFGTTASKLKVLWQRVKDLGVLFGNDFLPLIQDTVGVLGSITESFQDLDPATRKMIVGFTGVAAAIGPLTLAIGGVIALLGSPLLAPIALAVTAIGTLGIAAFQIIDNWEFFKSETIRIWNAIKDFIKDALDTMFGWIDDFVGWVEDAFNAVTKFLGIADRATQSQEELATALGGVNTEAENNLISFNKLNDTQEQQIKMNKAGAISFNDLKEGAKKQKEEIDKSIQSMDTYSEVSRKHGERQRALAQLTRMHGVALEDLTSRLEEDTKATKENSESKDENAESTSNAISEAEQFARSLKEQKTQLEQSIQAYKLAGDSALDYEAALLVIQARALGLSGDIEDLIRKIQELREEQEFQREFFRAFQDVQVVDASAWEVVFPEPDKAGREKGKEFGQTFTNGVLDEIRNTFARGIEAVLTFELDSIGDIFRGLGRGVAQIFSQTFANNITQKLTSPGGLLSIGAGGLGLFGGGNVPGVASLTGSNPSFLSQTAGPGLLGLGIGGSIGGIPGAIGGGLGGIGGGLAGSALSGAAASALGSTIGSIVPGLGTVVGAVLGGFLGKALGGLFGGDRPRFDVEVFNIGNEGEITQNLADGIAFKVSDVIRLGFDEAFRSENIFVKGKGGAEDIAEAEQIRQQVSDSLNQTVDRIFGIINQLPTEMAGNLRELFRNTELTFAQLVDDASLEFDEGSSKLEDVQERWKQFLEGDLQARFLTTIESFFVNAISGFGVATNRAEQFVGSRLEEIRTTESRQLRGQLGQQFLEDFQRFVDAFNFAQGNLGGAVDQSINQLRTLAESIEGVSGESIPTAETLRLLTQELLATGDVTQETLDKILQLRSGMVELGFSITQSISSLSSTISDLGGSAALTSNALQTSIETLTNMAESEALSLEERQRAVEMATGQINQLIQESQRQQQQAEQARVESQRSAIRTEIEFLRTRESALQDQLRLLENQQKLVDSIDKNIQNLLLGPQSIETPFQQLGRARDRIQQLFGSLSGATGARRVGIGQNIQDLFNSLLDIGGRAFQQPSLGFRNVFRETVSGLEDLRAEMEPIRSVEEINSSIESIQGRIEQLQQQSNQLQETGNNINATIPPELQALRARLQQQAEQILETRLGQLAELGFSEQNIQVNQLSVLEQIRNILASKDSGIGGGRAPVPGGGPTGTGTGEVFTFQSLSNFDNGGFGDFGSGTPAMLHGREAIFNEDQMRRLFSIPKVANTPPSVGAGSPASITNNFNINVVVEGNVDSDDRADDIANKVIKKIKFDPGTRREIGRIKAS